MTKMTKSAKPAKMTKSAKPAKMTKSAKPAKMTKSAKPAKMTKSAKPAKRLARMIAKQTVLGLLFLLCAAAGSAQITDDSRILRLRTEMEQTDQIIERAGEAVRVSRSPMGQRALEKAREIQRSAWENFRRGNRAGYEAAKLMTMQARELAKRAMMTSTPSEQSDDRVLRVIENAQLLLERAREAMAGVDRNNLHALLEMAEENLRRASEFHRTGHPRAAIKMANQVQMAARRILQSSSLRNRQGAGLDNHLASAADLIASIEMRIADCDSKRATRKLEQAKKALEKAKEFARESRPEAANRALRSARRFAQNGARECGTEANLAERLIRLQNRAEKLKDKIDRDDSQMDDLFRQIVGQLDRAGEHLENERTKAAAAALKAAQLQIKRLERRLSENG